LILLFQMEFENALIQRYPYLSSQVTMTTITFQDALRQRSDEALLLAKRVNCMLDNSRSHGGDSVFVMWANWSIDRTFDEVLEMFHILIATGAKHDASEDIFDQISDSENQYEALKYPVIHCLLSQPKLFPIKLYETGSPLSYIVHAMMHNSLHERVQIEREIVSLLQSFDIETRKSLISSSSSGPWVLLSSDKHHPVCPLACAIECDALSFIIFLFQTHPLLDLDDFLYYSHNSQSHWQTLDDWIWKFQPARAVSTFLEQKCEEREIYFQDVMTYIRSFMNRDISSLLQEFLQRPKSDPIARVIMEDDET
jgi:hypothetical protein